MPDKVDMGFHVHFKMFTLRSCLTFVTAVISLCSANGQIFNPGLSADPGNPNNWEITVSIDGSGEFKAIDLDHYGNDEYVNIPETYSHADGSVTPGYVCQIEGIHHSASLTSSCQASATYKLRWKGDPNHVPDKVIVDLWAETSYTDAPEDGVTGSGDPGLPIDTDQCWSDRGDQHVIGESWRQLNVTDGVATVSISGKATSTVNYTPTTYGGAVAGHGFWQTSCLPVSRALTITPSPIDTYYRSVGISGNVLRMLNYPEDLNNRKMTLGVGVTNDSAGTLFGSASVTGTATTIGNWTSPVDYTWSPFNLSLVLGYPVPATVTGTISFSQSELVAMAKGSYKVSGLSLVARDTSGLPPMSAKLTADIRAPIESIVDYDVYKNEVKDAVIMGGQPVRAYLQNPGMTQSIAVMNAYAETHLPSTWVFKGTAGLADPVLKLLNLAFGLDYSHPTSPQKTITDQLTRTWTAGPSTSYGELWELRADVSWVETDSIMATYGNDGYQADQTVGHVKVGSVAAGAAFVRVAQGV